MRAFARPALQAVDTRARKPDRHSSIAARSRQARGYPVSPPGRPKGAYRSAERAGHPIRPPGRPEGAYRSAERAGHPVSTEALPLRRLDSRAPGFERELAALIAFEAAQDPEVDATVARIVADVRARGDAALVEYTAKFDRVRVASAAALAIGAAELRQAFEALPDDQRNALEAAAARIRA